MVQNNAQVKTQRRGAATRLRLIEVTKSLLVEYDYQTLTLDRIANIVGVAKSSILWHFGSKEALFTEAVLDLFDEIGQKLKLDKAKLETVDERIRYMLECVAEYFIGNPAAKGIMITLLFDSQAPKAIHERIRKQWKMHNDEILDFASCGEQQISATKAAALQALIHGCYLQWYLKGRNSDFKQDLVAAYESLNFG